MNPSMTSAFASSLVRRVVPAIAACALLSLAGCGLPTYVPQSGEPLATAKLYGFGKPFMCKDGQRYQLDVKEAPNGDSSVALPVGKRITVWRYISTQGYQVITSCNPSISLIPQQGVTTAIHSGLGKNGCFIEAVREDLQSDTGVALDTSLNYPTC